MALAKGQPVHDSLRQHVTVGRLSGWARAAGFTPVWQHHRVTGFFEAALPGPLRRFLSGVPWVQDVMIGHIEWVLRKG
jgi:hypothetical protein